MLESELQELEEYDARLLDDSPFVQGTAAPKYESESFQRSADELSASESPFLMEALSETEDRAEEEGERASRSRRTRFRAPRPRAPRAAACDCGDSTSDSVADSDGSEDGEYGERESLEELGTEAQTFRGESPMASEAAAAQETAYEVDPYAAIRPALSPEHVNLPADEIAIVLGHLPASLALHQLLNSAAVRQATVASILGSGARRSVRVNGRDVPIPAYLRMVSRLCGEVAEQAQVANERPVAVAAPPPPPAPPVDVAGMILGVDLYGGNTTNAAGFTNLKNQGKKFAIAKSSQGTQTDARFDDPRVAQYYDWIRDSGMIRGSYHFFSNKHSTSAVYGGSIERQADTVLSVVKRLLPGDLAPALDLEDEPRGASGRFPLDEGLQPTEQGYGYRRGHHPHWEAGRDELLADIQDFLNRIETALGRTPMIYTSRMWTDTDMMNDPHVMSQYPLWTVWHAGRLADVAVGGWGHDWDFVQYAEQGGNWRGLNPYNEPHINIGGIDFDAYHWTIYGLRGLADIGRPGISINRNICYIAQSEADDSVHLLTGTPWTERNLSVASQPDLKGSDPALLASSVGLFLYYRKDGHLIEATGTASGNWQTAHIEDAQGPIHDPRAATNGSKRHVVYWGGDDDWHLLTWDHRWTSAGGILSASGIKTSATRGQSTGQPMVYVTNGVVHVAGRAGSKGHLYDVWFEGNTWRKDNLTTLGRDLAPRMPAATYSPCAYETSGGVGIVFRGVGGELWLIERSSNAPTNLMAATHATLAAGHPDCFVLNNEPHIVYRGSDKIIYDLTLHGGSWHVQQVCREKAAADPAATSAGTTGFAAIRAMSGVIYIARLDDTGWTCTATVSRLSREVAGEGETESNGVTPAWERAPQGAVLSPVDTFAEEITPAALRMLQETLNARPETEYETTQCANSTYTLSGFPEYAVTPDKLGVLQQTTLLQIASEIAASLSTDTPIVAVLAVGHADVALRKPVAERDSFEHTISRQRAENALSLIANEVRRLGGGGAFASIQTRALGVGSTQRLVMNPRNEFERGLNRRVVILLAQCTLPPEPGPVSDRELKERVQRLLKLLETRKVDPDTTGKRTIRAKCMLQKFLKPGVIDVFVDGGVANQTINGQTPRYYDCLIYGRNVGWKGNYDGKKHPMPWQEFMKFLATVSPILKQPGFGPSRSDDFVLKALGDVMNRIDQGINMTDQYITLMGQMSDPWVTWLLQTDGFAGDVARKKLQSLYRNNLTDENNIYSCWQ